MEFSALSDLWNPPVTKEELTDYHQANSKRAEYLYELGACVSGLHLQNLLRTIMART